jgi:hypothetical protein
VTETVPALGHDIVLRPAAAPTCTEPGLTVGSGCTRCDYIAIAQKEIPATGHNFEEGVCANCGVLNYTPGDLDDNDVVNEKDALYLLMQVLLPEHFTLNQKVDFDGSGTIDEDDAIYLLQHVLLPDMFPL